MQEKSMILNMVKDGIINVDEAVKLLNALNSSKLTPKEELEQNLYKFSKILIILQKMLNINLMILPIKKIHKLFLIKQMKFLMISQIH